MAQSIHFKAALLAVLSVCLLGVVNTAWAGFVFGEPVNLGSRVNRSFVEGTPVLPADGLSIYFDSNRYGGSGDYDVWVSTRETVDDSWSAPVSLPSPVNSSAWDGVPSISPDGLTLFLSSDRPGGLGATDIWVTSRPTRADPWSAPVNLGAPVNSAADEWTQSISADKLELYFTSWRSGGSGGADLWITTRETIEADWTAPVNLGPGVNSSADDINPSISTDGLCLFFFSLRPGGYGTRDIWMTTRRSRDDDWQTPVNVGPPINSASMDQGAFYWHPGRLLFFCSSRPGGYGSLDLMQAPVTPIVDFNGDGLVGGADVRTLADRWGTGDMLCDIGPMPWGDGAIDVHDLRIMAEHLGAHPDDPTLIGHWPFDETEGVVAHDHAGDKDGELIGDPLWSPEDGMIDGALVLDGVDDHVVTPRPLSPGAGPFSVLAWVKGGAAGQVIASQVDGANWLMIDAVTGALMTELAPPMTRTPIPPLVSEAIVGDDRWRRVSLVWDGSSRALYVDDTLVAEDVQTSIVDCYGALHIGCSSDKSPGSFFSGSIDDVRIYRRAVRP